MCQEVKCYDRCVGSFEQSCSKRIYLNAQIVECREAAKQKTGVLRCPTGYINITEKEQGTFQCDECFHKSTVERQKELG